MNSNPRMQIAFVSKKVAQQDVTKLNNFAGESERGRGKIRVRQSTAHKKGLPQEAMEIEV